MRVRWFEVDPDRYEEMVSVLLSRLHPNSQRIDGSGGDGGRDVQIVTGEDRQVTDVFELKSFTGRMTKGRRAQVAASLLRAAAIEPTSWTLIVPIDPTPGEEQWFADLGDRYPFPTTWRGKTWLDEKMAAYPDVVRYFLEGAAEEVVRLLAQLNQEEALLAAVPDALTRFEALHDRLNQIDPYYSYELSTGRLTERDRPSEAVLSVSYAGARVDVFEKYMGALVDRPITGSMRFAFREQDQAIMVEVQDALDYGYPVSIPSQVVEGVTLNAQVDWVEASPT